MTTSADSSNLQRTSFPSGWRMSINRDRLPRLASAQIAGLGIVAGPSTLTTEAPNLASRRPDAGPARIMLISTTLIPDSGAWAWLVLDNQGGSFFARRQRFKTTFADW